MADSVADTNEVPLNEISCNSPTKLQLLPLNEAPVGGSLTGSCEETVVGGDTECNTAPEKSLEESLDCSVRNDIKKKIESILAEVQLWSDTEKLLLYLKLPGSKHRDKNKDEYDLHTMPLSTTRAEQTQAFHWIRCHLEECENNSTLPKHEVYDEYKAHCESVNAARVLSAPDFGKIIKCVFPYVKARRLGTRGNSKYCYSGIQKKKIVKSPQLPNLMAPGSGDKNLGNEVAGSSGDKIGDDQALVAACILVCEWANKLLGRVFGTLIELARFLVGGSYVSSKSMAAFVVMSSNESSGSCNKLTLNSLKFSDEQASVSQKRKQTQQHLQRKLQQRQQHKQQQQHQLNLLIHPSTPTGKQFTPILPQTQNPIHAGQVRGLRIQAKPQQLQLSPKLNVVTSLHSPPTPCTPLIYNQSSQRTLGHLPSSTTLSPITPSHTSPGMHSSSPYNTKSPKRNGPCTPQSGTITPSPANAIPRHTPNGETTRFVFTPITNGAPECKGGVHGDEPSPPMLKRPTATHAVGQAIVNKCNPNKHGMSLPNTSAKDNPVSPCKQPRMILTNPPTTLNKQKNSFSQPMASLRTPKRPGLSKTSSTTPLPQNSTQASLPISPLNNGSIRNNITIPRLPRQTSAPSSCAVAFQPRTAQSSPRMLAHALSHQPQACQNLSSLDYGNNSSQDCRFNQTTSLVSTPPRNYLNHIPTDQELEAICNQLTNTASTAVTTNRCHSVPPLPQHTLPRAKTVMQPLTPQTNHRRQMVTQRPVNFSGHMDGLKQIRNRVLHGDTNNNSNNGGRILGNLPTSAPYTVKRNLMTQLEGVHSAPTLWAQTPSGISQAKLQPQGQLPEIPSDPLAGLNFDEIAMDMLDAAEVLFPDSNPFGNSWNASQPLTMDSRI